MRRYRNRLFLPLLPHLAQGRVKWKDCLNYTVNFLQTPLTPTEGFWVCTSAPRSLPFASLFLCPLDNQEHELLKGPLPFLLKTPFDILYPRAHDQNPKLLKIILKH